jgi:hypothetical protein
MEIDITDFVRDADPFEYSASVAERGQNAGPETWQNAKDAAPGYQFITEDSRNEFERWIREFGAWDREEIAAWSLAECNALLIQFISGNLREMEAYGDLADGSFDWDAWHADRDGGNAISQGDDGRVYFYMGS